MSPSKPGSALLLLGHGSTENPDSSRPTWELRDSIAASNRFGAVHCAFWKEEPSFRQVWPMIEQREVYVVPLFISEGYFTREVIPRELGLEGRSTRRGDLLVHYCDPVGVHPSMTGLLVARAKEITRGAVPPEETSLVIVGHGTNLNKQSAEAVRAQVEAIRASGEPFGEVLDAYMEEAPFVSDWRTLASLPTVVVVPFFIADGLHSYQDIPVLLGIEPEPTAAASRREVFRKNPRRFGDRTLYYSSAIGADPAMAEVAVDQVARFDQEYLR